MARKSQRKTKKSDKLRLRLDTLNAILGIALMAFVLLGTLPLEHDNDHPCKKAVVIY